MRLTRYERCIQYGSVTALSRREASKASRYGAQVSNAFVTPRELLFTSCSTMRYASVCQQQLLKIDVAYGERAQANGALRCPSAQRQCRRMTRR